MKRPDCRSLCICVLFLGFLFSTLPGFCALAAPLSANQAGAAAVSIEERLSSAEAARRFLAAYPDFLIAYDAKKEELIGWDGTRFPLADTGKNNRQEATATPPSGSPACLPTSCPPPLPPMETLRIRYRPIAENWPSPDDPPKPGEDAGRLRPITLWTYMYGAPAAKNPDGSWRTITVGNRVELVGGTVENNLMSVPWTLAGGGAKIRVNRANGVAQRLAAAVAELETISAEAKTAYRRIHGGSKPGVSGFYPRLVRASTCEISPHAFGVAVDVHWHSDLDYWLDSPQHGGYRYHSVMPKEIVAVFERHGFIWGGKWRHFDGMHFEYRPELLGMTMPPVGRSGVTGANVKKANARKPALPQAGVRRQH